MKEARDRFFNLILDNGVSLALAVAFCFAIYFIIHAQNLELIKAINQLREDKKELRLDEKDLIQDIIECYKLKNNKE